jgi:hypothetical protein
VQLVQVDVVRAEAAQAVGDRPADVLRAPVAPVYGPAALRPGHHQADLRRQHRPVAVRPGQAAGDYEAVMARWDDRAVNTWNKHLSALNSFAASRGDRTR